MHRSLNNLLENKLSDEESENLGMTFQVIQSLTIFRVRSTVCVISLFA